MSKVKISGGGRCNVTNGSASIAEVAKAYPRGSKLLKRALRVFNTTDTQAWYIKRGVELKTEDDGRVFPVSNSSQSIIDCLLNEISVLEIELKLRTVVKEIIEEGDKIKLKLKDSTLTCDKVIIATGGHPKLSGFDWLNKMKLKIIRPVPSLFTFNIPKNPITKLMGVVAENASVSIQGLKHKTSGPLLITHWGMSGPAILKLSAFAARELADLDYQFKAQVNWVGEGNQAEVFKTLQQLFSENPKKQISKIKPYQLPARLWLSFLEKAQLPAEKPCQEMGKKALNKLTSILTHDIYEINGKTTFKEEFVTCGGVSLSSIDHDTLQAKHHPNMYFAGEVLDIDGITGGYNFQAAWSTGFISGKLESKS